MVRSWWLILLLHVGSSLFGQDDPVLRVRKPKSNTSSLPHIAGCYTGEISFGKFCSGQLATEIGLVITSFTIRLEGGSGDSSLKISGNRIPSDLCERGKVLRGQRVFITNIVAIDSDGKNYPLPNMNLVISD